jgi:glycerol-3-phosphate acyltransferase PlsX
LSVTIAVDAMGGDHGPSVVVPACIDVLAAREDLALILVGDQAVIGREIDHVGGVQGERDRLHVRHASQQVEMDEPPGLALKNKKDSSMRVAIDLVKQGEAAACVSAGNTGALMATARFVLKTLPGIDRPAIITALPTVGGHTHVLDLGANVDASPEQLVQFAVMGSVLVSAVDNVPSPRVSLLNIGEEPMKGNERVRETAQLLAQTDLNYVGFAEGDDIYRGGADVIVCDGFVGNVALKSSEGVARMISQFLRQEFQRSWLTRLAGLVARPVLRRFRDRIDPRRYNGASFLGLRGIVVKSHGGADRVAFAHALMEALREVDKDVPRRIIEHLDARLNVRRQAS